jgi:hypothetical protein
MEYNKAYYIQLLSTLEHEARSTAFEILAYELGLIDLEKALKQYFTLQRLSINKLWGNAGKG